MEEAVMVTERTGKTNEEKLLSCQKKCEEICNHSDEVVFKDRCRYTKGGCGPLRFYFNPITTILSALVIWGLVISCIAMPTESNTKFQYLKQWITDKWTWFYIGTQDVWAVFIIVLYFSKYSKMKLGADDEKPEYSDVSYFTMLFAAGIGIGLFYYGVAEPIYHMEPKGAYGNRYVGRYSDNQRAQDAINITFFHWGIHGWIVYVIIGLVLGFVCYRKGLQMSMRTCFYPLVGDRIYGFFGDFIDTLSIICTMFGVCTSLGLGVIQLNSGLYRLNKNIELSLKSQIIIIWCITATATTSVVSGMKVGIKRLSEICFALGCFLMFVVLFFEDTWFLLNLFVQSCGYYLQWIVQLGFHTDAFAMQNDAPDGKSAPNWMNDWTIFYWGWWISWSPFVGMFIAKISRGRTIREFITYTLTIPCFYTFFWFSVFGGAGITMERKAQNLNISCLMYNETIYPMYGANSIWRIYKVHRLSCRKSTDMWFDVMEQYGDIGTTLSVLSIIGLVLYFVTSSDSGSLVIDCLSANGNPDPPVLQRVFWAMTEGATATALLTAGGEDSLYALQAVSVAVGLPYTIVVNFLCVGLWRAVQVEAGDYDDTVGQWKIGLFDCFSNGKRFLKTLLAAIFPWYFLAKIASKGNRGSAKTFWKTLILLAVLFFGSVALMFGEIKVHGLVYMGCSLLLGFFAYATVIRNEIREKNGLQGNLIEDLMTLSLVYPFGIIQLDEEMIYLEQKKKLPQNGHLQNRHEMVPML